MRPTTSSRSLKRWLSLALLACSCAPAVDLGAEQPDAGTALVRCIPGHDATCNDDPSVSSVLGRCLPSSTCTCLDEATVNPVTGRCALVHVDAGKPDAGAFDGGRQDAGSADAGWVDAGFLDAGVADAGAPDGGSLDAGSAPVCTVGQDRTCNDDPRETALWGRCVAGSCVCNAGHSLSPVTGRCRLSVCDLLAQDCPNPTDACYQYLGELFECTTPGTKGDGETCLSANECRQGSQCNGTCVRTCDLSGGAPHCPSGRRCVAVWSAAYMPGGCVP